MKPSDTNDKVDDGLDALMEEVTPEGVTDEVLPEVGDELAPETDMDFEEEAEVSKYPYAEGSPSGQSASKETRPSLKTAKSDDGIAPILDISPEGIFNSPELMDAYFPKVGPILRGKTDATSLTVDEVNELSRWALGKAIFANNEFNDVKGMVDNQLHSKENGTFGARLANPKLSAEGELDLTDIASLGVSIQGGGVITYPLVNSGFRIKMEPLGVEGEIKLEESILHRIGEVGRSTVGGGILAMDAIIIDCVLDKILDKVIDHNAEDVKVGDKGGLRKIISHKDIRPLIAVMNAIMHLDGYDYDIPCDKCHTLTRMNLNVLRSMHYDHGKLSTTQIAQLELPIKSGISTKNIRKYQEEFVGHAMSKEFTVGKMTYALHLRTGSIDDKMASYALIFNLLEKLAREVVGLNGIKAKEVIDTKCQELLARLWHLNYLPVVKSVDIHLPSGVRSASDPLVILQLLKTLSVSDDTGNVARFLTEFTHDNVVIFGTHVPKCPSCDHTTDDIRNYDPVIDFFIRRMSHTLSTSIVQEVMMKS